MKKVWKINLINNVLNMHARFGKIDKNKQPLSADLEFERIVIFSTTALGDLLFNTPAIRAIKQRYPQARIMMVSSDKNRDLVQGSEWFDEIVIWDNKVVRAPALIWKLRHFKPQITFLLHSSQGYDVLCARLSGSKYIVRDNFSHDNPAFNHWLDLFSPHSEGHLIQRKLDLIKSLGCDVSDTRMQFPISITKAARKDDSLIIGFQMGASGKSRCWPVEHFVSLAKKVLDQHSNATIVLTGAKQDQPIADCFYSALPGSLSSRVTSCIGKTSLPELIQLVNSMDLFVTGDTGPLHIALATQTPTVSLYVVTNPQHSGPYQDAEMHRMIYVPPEVKDDPEYPLKKIDVAAVYQAVESIINRQV